MTVISGRHVIVSVQGNGTHTKNNKKNENKATQNIQHHWNIKNNVT